MQAGLDHSSRGKRAGRATRALGCLVALLLALVLLRTFVADVYRVNSASMRPTLFGGTAGPGARPWTEWVLVRYGRAPALARFDLVVIDGPDGGEAIVKRVVGLPGEELRIAGGDLFVNERRLPPDAPRPAPVPVFDDRFQDPETCFYYAREAGTWRREDGLWRLDARAVAPGRPEGMLFYNLPLRDGYLEPDGTRIEGLVEVNDAVLECEVRLASLSSAGALRFRLTEEGDTFELRIVPREGGERVELVRRNRATQAGSSGAREQVLASSDERLDPQRFQRLRFANVDNFLVAELEGLCVLRVGYDENEPSVLASGPGQSVGPRVSLGGEGCEASLRAVRILRDLEYSASGTCGVEGPVFLGPDEVFVLGDNSSASQDSRHFGSVRLGGILGRPFLVVWPPGRMRRP
jgi:signal peptidase I